MIRALVALFFIAFFGLLAHAVKGAEMYAWADAWVGFPTRASFDITYLTTLAVLWVLFVIVTRRRRPRT